MQNTKRNIFKGAIASAMIATGVLSAGALKQNVHADDVNTNSTISQTSQAQTYTVQSGDTLNAISQKMGVSVQQLAQANKIADINLIFPGQEFVVSANGSVSVAPTSVAQAPQAATTSTPAANTTNNTSAQPSAASVQQVANTQFNGDTNAAAEWIAQRESGGSYTATNGQYIGKYQLSSSYLNGDYSAANQERVAAQYAQSRYGGWSQAQAFWQSHGWW